MTTLEWALKAYGSKQQKRYREFADYYDGKQPLEFATPRFRSAFGAAFEAFAYNRCANVVEALTDRLRISGFDTTSDTIGNAAKDLWDANRMDSREEQVNREAFTAGDAYVIVEEDPESGDVDIWPQEASRVRVKYDENRPGHIVAAVKRWTLDNGDVRLNLYLPGKIQKYIAHGPVEAVTAYERHTDQGDLSWPITLKVPDVVPVFHFPNAAKVNGYGRSELCDVIPIQNALNKSLMDLLVAMEFAAFPQRVLIDVDTNDDATAEAVQKFVAGIDQILALYTGPDGRTPTLAEFSAANITQYTDVVELFDQLISRVSKVPTHYLTLPSAPPSGESLKVAEAPWVAKIEKRQRAFRARWGEVVRYGLALKGVATAPGDVKSVYESAAPVGLAEELEHAEAKARLGVPTETILREDLGYSPDQIAAMQRDRDDRREEERSAA